MNKLHRVAAVGLFLAFFLMPSCGKKKVRDAPEKETSEYEISYAPVDSVHTEFSEDTRLLKVSVYGHLNDGCSSVYERGFREFMRGRTIYLVIPQRRPEGMMCTQVLKEFSREFTFHIPRYMDSLELWINGNIYKR